MKILSKLLVVLFCTACSAAYAAPFLVSDPVDPSTCGGNDQPPCPVAATCYEDDVAFVSDVAVQSDMSIRIDLAGRPPGNHRYTCIYKDDVGGVSLSSNPTQLGPLSPTGLNLIP